MLSLNLLGLVKQLKILLVLLNNKINLASNEADMKISARNLLKGKVKKVIDGALLAKLAT